jgi:uncharacterized protein YidB (DUF937 family)
VSLFDSIKDQLATSLGIDLSKHGGAMGQINDLLKSQGGLQGVLDKFHAKGLGDLVKSWVGTGANQPVSPAQVTQALGADQVAVMAGKAGTTPEGLTEQLSHLLPMVVDKLTPNGQMPSPDALHQAMGALGGMLGGTGPAK